MALTIERLETHVVRVNRRGDWVFCLIHTNEGITGLGEASHSLNDPLGVAALVQYGPRLGGKDPLRIEAIWASLSNRNGGRVEHTALSAIEQALWDIMGQRLGVPLRTLLGGAVHDRVRLYANINRHVEDRSPAGFAAAARQAVAEGFTAVKLAPFDEVRGPAHVRTGPRAAWLPGVERVRAWGPSATVELAVDCHGRFDVPEALAVACALEDCNLFWSRASCPTRAPTIWRASRPRSHGHGVGRECLCRRGFAPFLTRRVVDVIMPDVKHDGGCSRPGASPAPPASVAFSWRPHNPAGPSRRPPPHRW